MTPESMRSKLRNRRLSLGWTLQTTADKIGVVIGAVQNWETGRRDPQRAMLFWWAEVLGYKIELVEDEAFMQAPSKKIRK